MDAHTRLTWLVDSATWGGAETYVSHLLARLPNRFVCTVVATAPVPAPLRRAAEERGRLVVLEPLGVRWRRAPAAARVLAATRPDVVHVNLVDPRSNRVPLAAAVAGAAPAVATLHMTGGTGPRAAQRAALAAVYRRLAAVIVVSEELRQVVVDGVGVPASRVCVVANGVAVSPWPTPASSRPGALRVGGVGRLTAQKGFDVLVEAVRRLVGQGVDVDATVVGQGRDRERLAAAAAGLPIRFPGQCDDVCAFLASVDVFCLPSRAEGLPLALLEAMMSGLACVASAVGDVPTALGDAGVIVPPGDAGALAEALAALAEDPGHRRALGSRAAARARRHHRVDAMVAATTSVYDRVAPARS